MGEWVQMGEGNGLGNRKVVMEKINRGRDTPGGLVGVGKEQRESWRAGVGNFNVRIIGCRLPQQNRRCRSILFSASPWQWRRPRTDRLVWEWEGRLK